MKILKSFFIILIFALILSLSIYAHVDSNIPSNDKYIHFLKENKDTILYHILSSGKEFNNLKSRIIGSSILPEIYIYDLDKDSSEVLCTHHFPISDSNGIFAIISVNDYNNNIFCSVDSYLGELLNSVEQDKIIFRKNYDLYTFDGSLVMPLIPSKTPSTLMLSDNNIFDLERIYDFATCSSAIYSCSPIVTFNSEDIAYLSYGYQLSNYLPVGQGDYSICWAACIASIVNYTIPYSWYNATSLIDSYPDRNIYLVNSYPNYISNEYYYRAATFSDIKLYIAPYFLNSVTPYLNGVTTSLITNTINSGKPIYISSEVPNAPSYDDNLYHAVVVYGYNNAGDSYSVYIMDPWANSHNGGSILGIYYSSPYYAIGYNIGGSGTMLLFRRALVQ